MQGNIHITSGKAQHDGGLQLQGAKWAGCRNISSGRNTPVEALLRVVSNLLRITL